MNSPKRLVVAGAGLIGKRHATIIANCMDVELAAIVDPNVATKSFATDMGAPWFESLSEMFRSEKPDGVVLATPNGVHLENGLECIAAGCPILVEKPIAATADEAVILIDAARKANLPIQVGHHRRHNPIIQKARQIIDEGELGTLRTVHASCWLYKPDDYFDDAPWRKKSGAGPIAVNLVHDVDLVRHLCGEVVSVQAQAARSMRGFDNEDVAAAVLLFEEGVIGTITVSDTVVSPWSWEMTARENPAYPPTSQSCYLLGGTHGSMSLPDLTLWNQAGVRSWWEPINDTPLPCSSSNPLENQIRQFAAVLAGKERPLVSGDEGLRTLRVIEAIQSSARSGQTVQLS